MTETVQDFRRVPLRMVEPVATARRCSNCCEDIDIPLRHLLMPEVYLDAGGLEFIDAHGLRELRLAGGRVKFLWKGLVFEMALLELMFPDAYLNAGGLAFFEEHGLRQAVTDNVTVKLLHRCDQLDDVTGLCTIYETRPKTCRDFDCTTRGDCHA